MIKCRVLEIWLQIYGAPAPPSLSFRSKKLYLCSLQSSSMIFSCAHDCFLVKTCWVIEKSVMGQAFRKLLDTFFGNSEMRVHFFIFIYLFFFAAFFTWVAINSLFTDGFWFLSLYFDWMPVSSPQFFMESDPFDSFFGRSSSDF